MTPLVLTPDDDLEPLVRALADGHSVVLPTDTVYGLACAAHLPAACEATLGLKERDASKPTSIIAASLELLFGQLLPELDDTLVSRARRLLPGRVTLVLPNPARRYPWLCGDDPTRIGVRVPVLLPTVAAAIDRVGAIAATSANLAGEADPVALPEVPDEIMRAVAVAVDGGPTAAGQSSTVIDLSGDEPRILRAGALSEAAIRAILVD